MAVKYSRLVWAVSHISQIVGQGINAQHENSRVFSWQVNDPADPYNENPRWWMHILLDDNGRIGLVIEKRKAPKKSVIKAIKEYAEMADITVEVIEDLEREEA